METTALFPSITIEKTVEVVYNIILETEVNSLNIDIDEPNLLPDEADIWRMFAVAVVEEVIHGISSDLEMNIVCNQMMEALDLS